MKLSLLLKNNFILTKPAAIGEVQLKRVKGSGILLLIIVMVLFMTGTAVACTGVYLGSEGSSGISARNFDFMDGRGFIRYSPAGTTRSSQVVNDKTIALTWTSKYASLSFNSFFDKSDSEKGSTFIVAGLDGINTEGLEVGTCFLDNSAFPAINNAEVLDVGMVMQYLLDNFKSVDEAADDLKSGNYSVTSLPTQGLEIKLHFFLHDAKGKSAIVEFLNGKVKIVKNPDIPVITNSPYEESREQLKLYQGFGGEKQIPGGNDAQERFVRAAYYWRYLPKVDNADEVIKEAFSLMQMTAVSPGASNGTTQWTIITDIKAKKVYFRTVNNPDVAFIDLDKIAKSVKTSSDIDLLRTDLVGDISNMFSVSEEFCPESVPAAPDYADKKNWAQLPSAGNEKTVDVFFVHPTTYFFPNTWNESIEFGRQNAKVTGSMNNQASVFAGYCNIFAPHYRDAHIKALEASEVSKDAALAVAYSDVERAFDYYLQHFNHGKPFIIAGHSQGSDLLLSLLQKRFNDPELQKKLVAAYLIGWSVTPEDMQDRPYVKISQNPQEIGAIITYNTQSKNPGKSIVRQGGIGVNPLTMDTTSKFVSKEKHLGAVFFTEKGMVEIPHFTDAQTIDGALVVPTLKSNLIHPPFEGFYHSYDYNIFYRNIERNVAERIAAYMKENY